MKKHCVILEARSLLMKQAELNSMKMNEHLSGVQDALKEVILNSEMNLETRINEAQDAMKEIAITQEQVPSNRGYPGDLYSQLASRYEKAVDFNDSGSVTVLAVTTMPGDDVTHPVPDNTGYITEGQYYLKGGRIEPFGSLSRLKQNVNGKTRKDHRALMDAMIRTYSSYKETLEKKNMGFAMTRWDEKLLKYGQLFENKLMDLKHFNLARNYMNYRYKRALVRKSNTTDQQIRNTSAEELAAKTSLDIDLIEQIQKFLNDEEDVFLDEFANEIDQWVIDALKKMGCDTAKRVLAHSREELIDKADLEEDTVDEVIEILKAEFED